MKYNNRKFQVVVILLLFAILAAVLLLGFFKHNKSIDRVAYVELDRVFAEHPARTAAEAKLNQKAAQYQQRLEAEASNLSGNQQKQLLAAYQKELQNLETELRNSVLKEVETIIIQTAEVKDVKFVLEAEDVLYGGYNLTDDVLTAIKSEWQ